MLIKCQSAWVNTAHPRHSVLFNALNVAGLIAVVFNWTKPQKRLRQPKRGSSCHPVSPSVIYTVTVSCGRHPKATYCGENINLSHQLIIFLISWPRLPSQGNETARVSLGQTRDSPLDLKTINRESYRCKRMVEMSMNASALIFIIVTGTKGSLNKALNKNTTIPKYCFRT